MLEQLTAARTLINACLDVVDASTWGGDATDANFIAGQMRLLDVNIQEAKAALKGGSGILIQPWWRNPIDSNVRCPKLIPFMLSIINKTSDSPQTFDPPLPPNLAVQLHVVDAAIALDIRTVEPATSSTTDYHSPFNLRGLAVALGASRPQMHDDIEEIFTYRGQDVKVKEKYHVESLDPSLMAAMAKLNALERSVAHARKALDVVMGKDEL